LPDQTFEIKELLVHHSKRMRRNEYNPASGQVPRQLGAAVAQNGVVALGNGLLSFNSDSDDFKEFVGVIQILATTPSFKGSLRPFCQAGHDGGYTYRFGVTLADKSTSADVMVFKSVAEKIVGMPAAEAAHKTGATTFIDPNVAWEATIRAVIKPSGTFYILSDIDKK
jgi:hypothetical protein